MTAVAPCKCGCDTTDRATKIRHAHTGRSFSDETRAKMAMSAKRRAARGLSEETRAARSRATRGKKHAPDCGHCLAIAGAGNPRWNGGSSQKPIRKRLEMHGGAFDPTVTRRAVLDRDGWVCWLCDAQIPDLPWTNGGANSQYGTVDHVHPISEGGDHIWSNVRAACLRCNAERWYASRREVVA